MTAVETVSCSKIVVAINYRSPYSIGGVSTCLESNIVVVRARRNHRPWGTREVVVVKLGYHHRFKGIQSRGYELNFVRKGFEISRAWHTAIHPTQGTSDINLSTERR